MDTYEASQRAININALSPPAHFGPFVRLLFWISKTSFKRKQRGGVFMPIHNTTAIDAIFV